MTNKARTVPVEPTEEWTNSLTRFFPLMDKTELNYVVSSVLAAAPEGAQEQPCSHVEFLMSRAEQPTESAASCGGQPMTQTDSKESPTVEHRNAAPTVEELVKLLREELAEIIKHQFTGSREGMSSLQRLDDLACQAADRLERGTVSEEEIEALAMTVMTASTYIRKNKGAFFPSEARERAELLANLEAAASKLGCKLGEALRRESK